MSFKNPLMLPSYICGSCGHELQHIYQNPPAERAAERAVLLTCYTARCPQKGLRARVALVDAPAQADLFIDEDGHETPLRADQR